MLTAEPGDEVWERFGHNGIRVLNRSDGTDLVWDWGRFIFSAEGFWPRLIKGTMLYSMGGASTEEFLVQYQATGRAVWSQELQLTPEERWELHQAILTNAQPENVFYRYDYYLDNCSTRIRDLLDRTLDGRIRALTGERATAATFRSQTRRHLQDVPLAYLGIQLVLGNLADEAITEWEEMFLPLPLREYLNAITVERDGEMVPLISDEVQLLASTRPPAATTIPNRGFLFLLLGLAWAAAIAVTGRRAARGGWMARAALALAGGAWTFAAGLSGTILLGAWVWTDHVFWGWNENLLQANPLLLLVTLPLAAMAWRRSLPRWAGGVALVVAALSLAGLVLQSLPGLDQVNGEILALAIPPNLALGWTVLELGRARQPLAGD